MSVAHRPLALIAVREPALRAGIRLALEPRIECAVAERPSDAFDLLQREHPDVCFVDSDGESGAGRMIELIRRIDPRAPVVTLAHTLDEQEFLHAVRLGAIGYLSESVALDRLPVVVESVLRGEAVVPRALVRRLCDEVQNVGRSWVHAGGDWVRLTHREAEVLDLLRQGLATHEIADRLGIADVTVRRHRSSLYAKLGIHSPRELAQALAADVQGA